MIPVEQEEDGTIKKFDSSCMLKQSQITIDIIASQKNE